MKAFCMDTPQNSNITADTTSRNTKLRLKCLIKHHIRSIIIPTLYNIVTISNIVTIVTAKNN